MNKDIKPYKKSFDYSYCLGAFPTYELLKYAPNRARCVAVHSSYTDREKLEKLAKAANVPVFSDDKLVNRLSDKENVYVIGVFEKYEDRLEKGKNHIMLVNPGNMGNVGTIIRTAAAFDINDMAIISPGVDVFNPKVVRGSMGALFHTRIQYFDTYEDYEKAYVSPEPERGCYSFMLAAGNINTIGEVGKRKLFTVIFGNEATGLPDEYARYATPVIIPQSENVDSLNLTIAAGIGMYEFSKQ